MQCNKTPMFLRKIQHTRATEAQNWYAYHYSLMPPRTRDTVTTPNDTKEPESIEVETSDSITIMPDYEEQK